MKTIHVKASHEYDVLVENGLLDQIGSLAADCVGIHTACIVSDDSVFPLYGERVTKSLLHAGFRVERCVIPHGEQHKNLATYETVLTALYQQHLTRSDVVIALGGGVVGDLTGFVAATYLRGIRFIQVPTTLLAMVDSSVGGKTAVDLGTGKNQVGAFYQPSMVLCDPELLQTLPEGEFLCGCAEVIKYGMLGNAAFFEELKQTPIREQLENVITTCVAMKRDIVENDEFDTGMRQKLNLGHSIGHAVEACSDFSILHGQGVAIGMVIITRAAVAKGYCSQETLDELLTILNQYGLPTETEYALDDLAAAVQSDKKMSGSKMKLIVPESVGSCRIEPIPGVEVRDWMQAGGVK